MNSIRSIKFSAVLLPFLLVACGGGGGGSSDGSSDPGGMPKSKAPVALDDSFDATNRPIPIDPFEFDVLKNDSDPEGGALEIASVGQSIHGSELSITDTGSISFQSTEEFWGVDTFTYTVKNEEGLTSTATVTVNVADANDLVGKVPEFFTEFPEVTVRVGEKIFSVESLADGREFLSNIESNSASDIVVVEMQGKGSQSYIYLKSYLGEYRHLLQQKWNNEFFGVEYAEDATLTVSALSTAAAAIAEFRNDSPFYNGNTDAVRFSEVSKGIPSEILFKLSASVTHFIENGPNSLPDRYGTIQDFLGDYEKALAYARDNSRIFGLEGIIATYKDNDLLKVSRNPINKYDQLVLQDTNAVASVPLVETIKFHDVGVSGGRLTFIGFGADRTARHSFGFSRIGYYSLTGTTEATFELPGSGPWGSGLCLNGDALVDSIKVDLISEHRNFSSYGVRLSGTCSSGTDENFVTSTRVFTASSEAASVFNFSNPQQLGITTIYREPSVEKDVPLGAKLTLSYDAPTSGRFTETIGMASDVTREGEFYLDEKTLALFYDDQTDIIFSGVGEEGLAAVATARRATKGVVDATYASRVVPIDQTPDYLLPGVRLENAASEFSDGGLGELGIAYRFNSDATGAEEITLDPDDSPSTYEWIDLPIKFGWSGMDNIYRADLFYSSTDGYVAECAAEDSDCMHWGDIDVEVLNYDGHRYYLRLFANYRLSEIGKGDNQVASSIMTAISN